MPDDRTAIRVMVVEDDAGTRRALAALMAGSPGFTCAGAHRSGRLALEHIPTTRPQVILVDLEMPGMDGTQFLCWVREQHPEIECLVLTVHSEPEFVFPALAASASGYLVKGVAPAKLLEAVQEVADGGASMSSQFARMVLRTFRQAPVHRETAAALRTRTGSAATAGTRTELRRDRRSDPSQQTHGQQPSAAHLSQAACAFGHRRSGPTSWVYYAAGRILSQYRTDPSLRRWGERTREPPLSSDLRRWGERTREPPLVSRLRSSVDLTGDHKAS